VTNFLIGVGAFLAMPLLFGLWFFVFVPEAPPEGPRPSPGNPAEPASLRRRRAVGRLAPLERPETELGFETQKSRP
jgi:hypothetical protein